MKNDNYGLKFIIAGVIIILIGVALLFVPSFDGTKTNDNNGSNQNDEKDDKKEDKKEDKNDFVKYNFEKTTVKLLNKSLELQILDFEDSGKYIYINKNPVISVSDVDEVYYYGFDDLLLFKIIASNRDLVSVFIISDEGSLVNIYGDESDDNFSYFASKKLFKQEYPFDVSIEDNKMLINFVILTDENGDIIFNNGLISSELSSDELLENGLSDDTIVSYVKEFDYLGNYTFSEGKVTSSVTFSEYKNNK